MAEAGGMDPTFQAKLNALIAASGGKIKLVSGYRSVARQSALWNAAVAKYGSAKAARKWVAPPGKSNHNRGMAADLGGDLALARRLAPRFGLHFPMGHEPWHVEPAGLRGAKAGHTPAPSAGATSAVPPTEDRRAFTVEYQLANLGQILMGGDSGDQEQQG